MGRKPRAATETSPEKSRAAIQTDVSKFLAEGGKIKTVKPGETGQDEKNRSKHIVISRKDD